MSNDARTVAASTLASFLHAIWQRGAQGKPPPDDQDATDLLGAVTALTVPDRAAALRDVETLLRRVDQAHRTGASDPLFLVDDEDVPQMSELRASDLAALIVDRVLGGEQDGEKR